MTTEETCTICLDTGPPPIQKGCACRGDAGLAHVDCLVHAAVSQQAQRDMSVWWRCQTCNHDFTGAMLIGLANAWVTKAAIGNGTANLPAKTHLAKSLCSVGKYAEAEPVLREMHALLMRAVGAESESALAVAYDLAQSLSGQRKYVDSERLLREVLGVQNRVLGAEHTRTLSTVNALALSLLGQERHTEAEVITRKLLEVRTRVLGAEHHNTLTAAHNVASSLSGQGKHAEAEAIEREVLGLRKRVLGPEHPTTLASASNLADFLSSQSRHAEVEVITRELLAAEMRVLGAEHEHTMGTAKCLAKSLSSQGRHAEEEQILREVLGAQTRVFGAEHDYALSTLGDLSMSVGRQRKFAEEEPLLHSLLASRGPAHPISVFITRRLAQLRAIREKSPTKTKARAPAAMPATVTPQFLTGTRVAIQRLVAKPEHNGKRARVLSFDARAGRYAVALDCGKELSLKAECLARAGCAAAGCASEEAGSVCARCEVARYCSRECQRSDWKVHKLECTAAHATRS